MTQEQIATKAKELVKAYLSEGMSDWFGESQLEEFSDDAYDDVLDEADDILDWLAQRLDTALTGRR